MRYVLFGFVVALGAGLSTPAVAHAEQGQVVARSDVSRDATDTANQMANNVEWLAVIHFDNDGKPYYRFVGKDSQMRTVIAEVSPEGKPLILRTCVAYQDVPAVARRALKNVAPGFEPKDGDLSVQAVGYNDKEAKLYMLVGTTPGNSDATYLVLADGSKVVDGSESAGPTL